MLYTVGKKSIYEPGLATYGEEFRKTGRKHKAGYVGGTVFLTKSEAESVIEGNPDFGVYGLLTTEYNTYTIGKDRFLLESCQIVKGD